MSKPVTLAICGAGSRGLQSYAPYALAHPDEVKVVAVAEPREWHRNEAARLHNIQPGNIFKDWRKMAQAPRLADGVIIATQDADHKGPALAFMERKYDILLEKPMAPNEKDCREITVAARRSGVVFALCHVLRYTAYFRKLKELIDSGVIGQIATVRHFEPVGFWHFAHSYVRGNWRNEQISSPMLLAKCCHDMDILLFLLGKHCKSVSSFGSLKHFRRENRPAEASTRCWDCPLAAGKCPYSARKFYMDCLNSGNTGWPLNVITDDLSPEGVELALKEGPYGRCVYSCDNDVLDHQVVAMEFEDDISATFTVTAFTGSMGRETEIHGSHGVIRGNEKTIRITDFRGGWTDEIDVNALDSGVSGGHGGGDTGIMRDFVKAIHSRNASLMSSGPDISMESHMMVFAAERARHNRTVEHISRI